jgi:hypothetical protein
MITAMIILGVIWIWIAYEVFKSPLMEDDEKDY